MTGMSGLHQGNTARIVGRRAYTGIRALKSGFAYFGGTFLIPREFGPWLESLSGFTLAVSPTRPGALNFGGSGAVLMVVRRRARIA